MGQRCCKELFGPTEFDDDDLSGDGKRSAERGLVHSSDRGTSDDDLAKQLYPQSCRCRGSHLAAPGTPCPRCNGNNNGDVSDDGSANGGAAPIEKRRSGLFSWKRATVAAGPEGTSGTGKGNKYKSSGSQMFDRTVVVCLLGSGAFGTVSLVFDRMRRIPGTSPGGVTRRTNGAGAASRLNGPDSPLPPSHGEGPSGSTTTPPAQRSSTSTTPQLPPPRSTSNGDLGSPLSPTRTTPQHTAALQSLIPLEDPNSPLDSRKESLLDHTLSPQQTGGLASVPTGPQQPPGGGGPAASSTRGTGCGNPAASNSQDDIASVGSSFAYHSFAHSGRTTGASSPVLTRTRFSVVKRISKERQRQMSAHNVDIASERFRSAQLYHPFVMRLREASQTTIDLYNTYPFALGAELGLMLSRRTSVVQAELSCEAARNKSEGANIATLAKELSRACVSPNPAPSACTCTVAAGGGAVDPRCPVSEYSVTRGGLRFPTVCLAAFELLSAIHYLATHPSSITHGDIKPDNIFITDAGHLELGDFSMMTQDVTPEKKPTTTVADRKHKQSNLSFYGFFGGGKSKQSEATGSTGDLSSPGMTSPNGGSIAQPSGSVGGATNAPAAGGQPASGPRTADRNTMYMPPEILLGTWRVGAPAGHNAAAAGPKAPLPEPVLDMWSYGVLILQLASGVHPFFPLGTPLQSLQACNALCAGRFEPMPIPQTPNPAPVGDNATEAEREASLRHAEEVLGGLHEALSLLNDLIAHCICPDPTRRMTASEAQLHPFFRHPLVLAHLGVDPTQAAANCAVSLHRRGITTEAEAEALLFDEHGVRWDMVNENPDVADMFSQLIWSEYVVPTRLRPQVVPREVCANGGYFIPDAVDLSLDRTELLSSFCNSSSLNGALGNSAGSIHLGRGGLGPSASTAFESFDTTAPDGPFGARAQQAQQAPLAATSSVPPPTSEDAESPLSPPPHQPPGGMLARSPRGPRTALDSCDQGSEMATNAGDFSPNTRGSLTVSGGGAAVVPISFGDPRVPPFAPVDLRFFCSTQAEFDNWTDEKNKLRLSRSDTDLRRPTIAGATAAAGGPSVPMPGRGGKGGRGKKEDALLEANYTYYDPNMAYFNHQ